MTGSRRRESAATAPARTAFNRGFTLLEVLVVLAILTGVLAVTLPALTDGPCGSSQLAGTIYKIRVQRAGTGMLVGVRLNNSVTAPFFMA